MRRLTLLFCLAVFVFFAMGASAQQVVLRVPADYPTIQAAIDHAGEIISGATPGDVLIEVSAGTYLEAVNLTNRINSPTYVVTLRAIAGPATTIIDSSGIENALKGRLVQNFILDGFTVRNRYDPLQICCPKGINLNDSTKITVQNSHFDTTTQAMWFNISDPNVTSVVYVLHNTAFTGQGTDPTAPDYVVGQAVSFATAFNYDNPDLWLQTPASDSKLVVADNVFRSIGGSCVRFIFPQYTLDGFAFGGYPKGSLTLIGNDLSSPFAAGLNLFGGHGHLIAGNRIHESAEGVGFSAMLGARFENNLVVRNYNGLVFWDDDMLAGPMLAQPTVVDYNTIVDNIEAGIVYSTSPGSPRGNIPLVSNNVIAFNDGGGLVAVEGNGETMTYIPIDFHSTHNDVYGNTVRSLYSPNRFFNFLPITNPQMSNGNYSGVINSGHDLSVNPDFVNFQDGDFALKPNSKLVNAGTTPGPMRDLAGNMRDSKPDIGAFEVVEQVKDIDHGHPKAKGKRHHDD
ncbi:MAG: right-handed parallel beta-helix repeat-containing protein [Terriglobales bacterium]